MAREALGVVGAAVGFVAGGPQGALIGFNIGYGVGSYIDPVTIPHPGLNDAPIQTSRDGVPITLFWGLQYGHGNIIQKNPEVIVTDTERVGKGGGQEVETKRRFRTFAIGVGQSSIGPLAEITRIWENNRLVYDIRDEPAIPVEETEAYAENLTIYYGDEGQLPDPELEAHWGADDTPAYRGLCYVVWNNYDLTDFGGAIPQYAFEVNGSKDHTITSKPYPIESLEGLALTVGPGGFTWSPPIEGLSLSVTPADSTLTTSLHSTSFTEGLDLAVTPQNGALGVKLHSTSLTEGIDLAVVPQDGTLEVRLIQHDYEDEGVAVTVTPQNGTLI